MSRNAICAMCEHFHMAEYPEQAAQGLGRCTGYDQGADAVPKFVPWDARFTVLYGPAKNMAARRAWIERINQREAATDESGNTERQP